MNRATRVITAVGLARLNGLRLRAGRLPGQRFAIGLKPKKPAPEKKP